MLSRYKTGEVIYDCYNKNYSNNKRFHIYNTDNAFPCIKSQGALIVDGGAYIEKNLVVDDFGYLKKVDHNNLSSLVNIGYINAINFTKTDPRMEHLDIFNTLQQGFVSSDGSAPSYDPETQTYTNPDYYFKMLINDGDGYGDNELSINLIKDEQTNLILDNDGTITCKSILLKDENDNTNIELKDDGTIICKTLQLDGDNDFNINSLNAENIKCNNPPIDNNDVVRKQDLLLNYSNDLSIDTSNIKGFENFDLSDEGINISSSNFSLNAKFENIFDKLFIKINNLSINYNNINTIYTTFKIPFNLNQSIINNLNIFENDMIKFNVSTLYDNNLSNGFSLLFETYLNLQDKYIIIQILTMPDTKLYFSINSIILSYF